MRMDDSKSIVPISRAKSLKEKCYDIVKELVLTGKLEQGVLHNEKTLSESLGVSRTPVREALLELSREGMIVFVPNKGFKIREVTPTQVRDVFEVRRIIETHIIRTVAGQLTKSDLQKIGKMVEQQEQLAEQQDKAAFIEQDKGIHLFLASKMGNQQIVSILMNMRDQIHFMGVRAVEQPERMHAVVSEHRRIYAALQARDGARACDELISHLINTEQTLIERITSEE
jgi:DNA-binding GntR family transcriptional regulator